ncbi:MAG: ImmA/IrrE family metallo-endopeptidase [Candidatus Thiodiazotropha sp.]
MPEKDRPYIRALAHYLRDFIAAEYGIAGEVVNVVDLIQKWGYLRARGMLDNPDYRVVEDLALPGRDAEYRPRPDGYGPVDADDEFHCFLIRETIWDAATAGDPAASETLAHEVGHCVLQHPAPTHMRMYRDEIVDRLTDSEWQANTFMDEFLMDSRQITLRDGWKDIRDRFNVTQESAIRRIRELIYERRFPNERRG